MFYFPPRTENENNTLFSQRCKDIVVHLNHGNVFYFSPRTEDENNTLFSQRSKDELFI
ncbi:hypothetical protein DPEC_G00265290 [Dallia pectoralis]|uniref:Uncharacterized protein n=1 Tax=Dallia pectoralis TaxID=75939 RepID=A0ACC2FSR0_DALPE|nr:hypothetical protein DPEC_G00265290 [Dallia pectoralis]